MKARYSSHFERSFRHFPPATQRKFKKQLGYLLRDIRHPSLRAKKYDEALGIWQARVDKNIRFYFLIQDDTYILLDMIKHPQ